MTALRRAYLDLADRIRIERLAARLAEVRLGDVAMMAIAVVLAGFPLLVLSGYHYEEGLTVAFAKDAMVSDRWYDPQLYGFRFVERPVLQSWIVALVSLPFGTVTQITARLPTIVAVFAGAALIAHLLRGKVSRQAILFSALGFVFSPTILQKIAVAESEVLLTVFQFAAFVVWWKGRETGHVALWRWVSIGFLLMATAMFKGPQPAAFFAIGVGVFILSQRESRQLPGYALAGLISLGGLGAWYWSVLEASDVGVVGSYMRFVPSESLSVYLSERLNFLSVVIQFMPVALLAVPALADLVSRRTRFTAGSNRLLVMALGLYGLALVALAVWPGGQPRYAMAWLPACACLAGLAYDRVAERALQFSRVAIGVLAVLVAYQVIWGWIVGPAFWREFGSSRVDASIVEATAPDLARPLVAQFREADPILAYLDGRVIRYAAVDALPAIEAPAYLLAWPKVAEGLATRRPDLEIERVAALKLRGLVLYDVSKR